MFRRRIYLIYVYCAEQPAEALLSLHILIFFSLDSFTKEISENIKTVQEGATLRLEVKREQGAFRDVHVTWRLTWSSGIANASSQISPINGSLTFKQVCNYELKC